MCVRLRVSGRRGRIHHSLQQLFCFHWETRQPDLFCFLLEKGCKDNWVFLYQFFHSGFYFLAHTYMHTGTHEMHRARAGEWGVEWLTIRMYLSGRLL